MDIQGRFDTLLYLFREELGVYQKEVADYLQEQGFTKVTESVISRAKSRINSKGYRISDGEIPAARMEPWVLSLEEKLVTFNIHLAEDQTYYFNDKTGEQYEYIHQGQEKIKSTDGIIRSYPSIPRDLIQKKIRTEKEVKLLQTYMSTIETYAESFEDCLSRGGHVQLLLMNPRGLAAKVRSRSLPNKFMNIEQLITQNLQTLQQIKTGPGNLEIRFYDEFPGVELFIFPDRIFYGLYLHQQFAKDGHFSELLNEPQFSLNQNLLKNWQSIWDQAVPLDKFNDGWKGENIEHFLCHYIREGEYRTFEMRINRDTTDVLLTNTPSRENFKGSFDAANERVLSIMASTSNKMENGAFVEVKKRTAFFLIYTNINGFWRQELSTGVFINTSPSGLLRANLVVIENLKLRNFTLDPKELDHHINNIRLFLEPHELKAENLPFNSLSGLESYLQEKAGQRLDQRNWLPLLSGHFHLFYTGQDDDERPCICRRPLTIDAVTERAEREIWNENRSRHFSISMPNTSKLLLYHLSTGLTDSEFIFLRRYSPNWIRFQGKILKVYDANEIRLKSCYLLRSERKLGPDDYIIYYDSPTYQELCRDRHFAAFFPGEDRSAGGEQVMRNEE
ncbi:MAG: hypothetical protein R2824_00020 [Saprospiraceae bacterium]|nr:hypothetical protein [Lewinella sp.]